MSETNLTTTITSEEYKILLLNQGNALRLAESVAADWLASTGFSFSKPSAATLEALRRFDHELYFETEKKVKEAEEAEEAKRLERMNDPNASDRFRPWTAPGAPLRDMEIKIGDIPGSDPQITCETDTKGETT